MAATEQIGSICGSDGQLIPSKADTSGSGSGGGMQLQAVLRAASDEGKQDLLNKQRNSENYFHLKEKRIFIS